MKALIRNKISQLLEYSLVPGSTDLPKRLKVSFSVFTDTSQRIPNGLIVLLRRIRNQRIKAVIATTKKVFALFRKMVRMNSLLAIEILIKSGNLIGKRGSAIYILEIPAGSLPVLNASKNTGVVFTPTSSCFYNTNVGRLWGLKCGPWDKLISHVCLLGYTTNF